MAHSGKSGILNPTPSVSQGPLTSVDQSAAAGGSKPFGTSGNIISNTIRDIGNDIKTDWSSAKDAFNQTKDNLVDIVSGADKPKKDADVSFLTEEPGNWNGSSGSSHSSGKSAKEEFDWIYADMAKHYGMSKETGYAEAMENTSYQRAVKDMQAAGLNPAALFGSNNGNGSGTPGYIRSASTGGGGGGGGYSRSYGSARSNKLFSSNAYAGIAGVGTVIGGLAGLVTTKSAGGAAAGAAAGASIATGIAKIANAIMNG